MKTLNQLVEDVQKEKDAVDMDWINDDKPVQTKNGLQAIITKVDLGQVPNVIKGKVKVKDKLVDYEWYDTGECLRAHDQYNNPKKPDDGDSLIKVK